MNLKIAINFISQLHLQQVSVVKIRFLTHTLFPLPCIITWKIRQLEANKPLLLILLLTTETIA
jgi:hypothetical protein